MDLKNFTRKAYGNWVVYENNEILYVTAKTYLTNIIDKLERKENCIYSFKLVTDKFVKAESLPLVNPNGELSCKFDNEFINDEFVKYMENRYGTIEVNDDIMKIKTNDGQLVERVKKKLSQEQYDALVKKILDEYELEKNND